MKTTLFFICGVLFSSLTFAQGSILGFTVEPQSPSETDYVKVYAGLSFTSGNCPLDNKAHTTSGFMTEAYTHHCVGILTYICNTVDTFNLGYLPAGSHKFRLTLSSGAAPPPCTPGIVADDMDSTIFVVTMATGIYEFGSTNKVASVYPNPISYEAIITINKTLSLEHSTLRITDLLGRTVKEFSELQSHEIKLSADHFEQGIYFYQLIHQGSVLSSDKLIIE